MGELGSWGAKWALSTCTPPFLWASTPSVSAGVSSLLYNRKLTPRGEESLQGDNRTCKANPWCLQNTQSHRREP